MFVRAFRSQLHDDWREGRVGAFRHFGGVLQTVLIDNPRALIIGRGVENGAVRLHPAFEVFCRDRGVVARACQPSTFWRAAGAVPAALAISADLSTTSCERHRRDGCRSSRGSLGREFCSAGGASAHVCRNAIAGSGARR